VPSASFQCRDGQWLHITCSDQHWEGLCRVLALAEWGADPGLRANAGRVARRDEVMSRLRVAIAEREREELLAACTAAGVPAGPINDVATVLSDPHVRARGLVASFDHPLTGAFPALPVPFKLDGFDDPQVGRPPLLGEHTDEILAELGYIPQQIADLRARKVV
jgi:crotonobetainyl-CoA:carnitine CoA-transferase CaiB-like acyl-CoA transferase